eukprot:CAMPEP_0179299034 /NCGR_PEP_ID=MMETSP0797-20121207/46305_1 /TAXON_ID=47934 /ORGANISM="Dinophysis acuminata, Strain DAEP01" /LENGTH=71 /DNA_ID=CAMNT_0021008449 /DNA_START=20 /DNA_END=232 /DNA_ORIENTATION=-
MTQRCGFSQSSGSAFSSSLYSAEILLRGAAPAGAAASPVRAAGRTSKAAGAISKPGSCSVQSWNEGRRRQE